MDTMLPERTVYFKSLLFRVLRQWRLLLLLMLAGGLLLGGGKALKSTAGAAENSADSRQLEEKELTLTDYRNTLEAHQRTIRDNKQRLEEVRSAAEAAQACIARQNAYIAACRDSQTALQTRLNKASGDTALQLQAQLASLAGEILRAQKDADEAAVAFNGFQEDIRRLEEETVYGLPQACEKLERQIAELQEEIAELQEDGEGIPGRRRLKKIALLTIVGMLLGAAVIVLYSFFRLLLAKSLQSAAEVTDSYALPLLGSLYVARPKHRTRLDRWLWRLSGEPLSVDTDAVYRQMAARIRLQTDGGNGQTVRVTGPLPPERLQALCDALTPYADGTVLQPAADPATDPDAALQLAHAPVLAVGERGVTDAGAFARTMAELQLCRAKLLGYAEL